MDELPMRYIGKAILTCQVHLTAIMILVAGMPHFVCRCPGELAKADASRPTAQPACCCCGSCGSISSGEQEQSKATPSCCGQKSSPGKSKGPTRSLQATGNDCTKVTGLRKDPALSTIRFVKPIEVSGVWEVSLTVLSPSLQAEPQDSVSRWTGHSPAPPADRVISLQRLLI
jgi:hypothetical protein